MVANSFFFYILTEILEPLHYHFSPLSSILKPQDHANKFVRWYFVKCEV